MATDWLSALLLFLAFLVGIPIILFLVLFLLIVVVGSFAGRDAPPEPLSYETNAVRVRNLLAQKNYAEAFRVSVNALYIIDYATLQADGEFEARFARRHYAENEELIDLAIEALRGKEHDDFTEERRALFGELASVWEQSRRWGNLLLSGGDPGVTEAEWDALRLEFLKLRIRVMELQLAAPSSEPEN